MGRVRWGLALVTALSAPSLARGDKPEPTKEVVALLGKLKKKRESGDKHAYKLEFSTSLFINGELTKSCSTNEDFQIDWKSSRFRRAGWDGCLLKSLESVEIYDGEKVRTKFREVAEEGKPSGDGAWKYGMVTGRLTGQLFQYQWWPVFLHKGILPGRHDHLYGGYFVFDSDPANYAIDGEVTWGGRKCVSLRTVPKEQAGAVQFVFIIDPGKDDSVVRLESYSDGKRSQTWDIKVEAGKEGSWAPSRWEYTSWDPNRGVPNRKVVVAVTRFAKSASIDKDPAFELTYPEGARVVRSHLEIPKGKNCPEEAVTEYVVKDGKLAPDPAPPAPNGGKR